MLPLIKSESWILLQVHCYTAACAIHPSSSSSSSSSPSRQPSSLSVSRCLCHHRHLPLPHHQQPYSRSILQPSIAICQNSNLLLPRSFASLSPIYLSSPPHRFNLAPNGSPARARCQFLQAPRLGSRTSKCSLALSLQRVRRVVTSLVVCAPPTLKSLRSLSKSSLFARIRSPQPLCPTFGAPPASPVSGTFIIIISKRQLSS